MQLKSRKTAPEAVELWTRRADALKAGTMLVSEKPDREDWTADEVRTWRYAAAISRRMNRLH